MPLHGLRDAGVAMLPAEPVVQEPEGNRYEALRAAVPPKPLRKCWSGHLSTPS